MGINGAGNISSATFETFFNRFESGKAKNLRRLNLNYNKLSSESLKIIAQKFPLLEKLDLFGCDGVSDDGLKHVILGCKHLKELDLRGCRDLTGEGLSQILTSRQRMVFK